jgi:hypothetical protein
MSTVAEIEAAISKLPLEQAEELSEWLEQWLEDQREMAKKLGARDGKIQPIVDKLKTDGAIRVVKGRILPPA